MNPISNSPSKKIEFQNPREQRGDRVMETAKRNFEEDSREYLDPKKSRMEISIRRVNSFDLEKCKGIVEDIDQLFIRFSKDISSYEKVKVAKKIVDGFYELKNEKEFRIPERSFIAFFRALFSFYLDERGKKFDSGWIFKNAKEIHATLPLRLEFSQAHLAYLDLISCDTRSYYPELEGFINWLEKNNLHLPDPKKKLARTFLYYAYVISQVKMSHEEENKLWDNRSVPAIKKLKLEYRGNPGLIKKVGQSFCIYISHFNNRKDLKRLVELFDLTKKFQIHFEYNQFREMFSGITKTNAELLLGIYCEAVTNREIVNYPKDMLESKFLKAKEGQDLVDAFASLSSQEIIDITLKINKTVEKFDLKKSLLFSSLFIKYNENINLERDKIKNKITFVESALIKNKKDPLDSDRLQKDMEEINREIESRNIQMQWLNREIQTKVTELNNYKIAHEDLKKNINGLVKTEESFTLHEECQKLINSDILINFYTYDLLKLTGEMRVLNELNLLANKHLQVLQKNMDEVKSIKSINAQMQEIKISLDKLGNEQKLFNSYFEPLIK